MRSTVCEWLPRQITRFWNRAHISFFYTFLTKLTWRETLEQMRDSKTQMTAVPRETWTSVNNSHCYSESFQVVQHISVRSAPLRWGNYEDTHLLLCDSVRETAMASGRHLKLRSHWNATVPDQICCKFQMFTEFIHVLTKSPCLLGLGMFDLECKQVKSDIMRQLSLMNLSNSMKWSGSAVYHWVCPWAHSHYCFHKMNMFVCISGSGSLK